MFLQLDAPGSPICSFDVAVDHEDAPDEPSKETEELATMVEGLIISTTANDEEKGSSQQNRCLGETDRSMDSEADEPDDRS